MPDERLVPNGEMSTYITKAVIFIVQLLNRVNTILSYWIYSRDSSYFGSRVAITSKRATKQLRADTETILSRSGSKKLLRTSMNQQKKPEFGENQGAQKRKSI
jgi:hypothetical protein